MRLRVFAKDRKVAFLSWGLMGVETHCIVLAMRDCSSLGPNIGGFHFHIHMEAIKSSSWK